MQDSHGASAVEVIGHSAGGPGSTGAVYSAVTAAGRRTAAAFVGGNDEGVAEFEVLRMPASGNWLAKRRADPAKGKAPRTGAPRLRSTGQEMNSRDDQKASNGTAIAKWTQWTQWTQSGRCAKCAIRANANGAWSIKQENSGRDSIVCNWSQEKCLQVDGEWRTQPIGWLFLAVSVNNRLELKCLNPSPALKRKSRRSNAKQMRCARRKPPA